VVALLPAPERRCRRPVTWQAVPAAAPHVSTLLIGANITQDTCTITSTRTTPHVSGCGVRLANPPAAQRQ
jgi:hypothetical protein